MTVDAHSKWLDICPISSTNSNATISPLRVLFSAFGLPEAIHTDNASVFTSTEINDFFRRNGINYTTSAPYHPASNGLAERAVQTFKLAMRKQQTGTLEEKLARFLFSYRITPHTTTGETPAKLLMGRQLISHLSLFHPNKVARSQQQQKRHHVKSVKSERRFEVGDHVYAFAYSKNWVLGEVVENTGPVSARVQADNQEIRRHNDQLQHGIKPVKETPDIEINADVESASDIDSDNIIDSSMTSADTTAPPDANVATASIPGPILQRTSRREGHRHIYYST